PFLASQLQSSTALGLLIGANSLAAMLGAALAGPLRARLPWRWCAAVMIGLVALSLLAFVLLPAPINLLPFLLRNHFDWMLLPWLSAEINEQVAERHRATLLSVSGLAFAGLSLAGFPLGGVAVASLGLTTVFVALGVVELGCALAYM